MIIEYEIPKLNDKTNPFIGYWGKKIFIGQLSDDQIVNALADTYVRLVFSATDDYNHATQSLKDFFSESSGPIRISSLQRAIGRFESCITNMHRAVMAFVRLRRRATLPPTGRQSLNERKPIFATDAISDQLRNVRNEIQHIEEALAKGKIPHGLHHSIMPDGHEVPFDDGVNPNQTKKTFDRLKIGHRELQFSDLSQWLDEMIQYADILQQQLPSTRTSAKA